MLWCFISAFLSRPQLGNSAKGVGRFRSRLATLRCSRAAAKCGRRSVSHQVLVSDKSHAGSKHCLLSFTANCQQGQDDNLDRGCMLTGFAGKKNKLGSGSTAMADDLVIYFRCITSWPGCERLVVVTFVLHKTISWRLLLRNVQADSNNCVHIAAED